MRGRMVALDGGDDARGLVDIVEVGLALAPAFSIGSADEAIARLGECVVVLQAERDAQDIGRVGLQDDGLAFAVDFQALVGGLAKTDHRG